MSFDADYKAAAADLLEVLGEDVSYTPRGGVARTIRAIVDRSPPQRIDARGNVFTPRLTIQVLNDATDGIDSASMDAGGSDRVSLAYRPGTTAQSFGVYFPPEGTANAMNGAMLELDLR